MDSTNYYFVTAFDKIKGCITDSLEFMMLLTNNLRYSTINGQCLEPGTTFFIRLNKTFHREKYSIQIAISYDNYVLDLY